MMSHIWHCACSGHASGLIISPETNYQKNDRGQWPKYFLDDVNVVVKCIPLKKSMTEHKPSLDCNITSLPLTEICPSRRVGHFKAPC